MEKRYTIGYESGRDKDGHFIWVNDNGEKFCKVVGLSTIDVYMKAERVVDLLNANNGKPNVNPNNKYF